MVYTTLLFIHILGACATGVVAAYAGIIMWQHEDQSYRRTSIILGSLGGFEVLTGTLLAVVSLSITSISLCINIIVYLSVVLFVEALLLFKMRSGAAPFPVVRALSPMVGGLSLFLTAIAYGL